MAAEKIYDFHIQYGLHLNTCFPECNAALGGCCLAIYCLDVDEDEYLGEL